jgi:hypothetical protein
MWFALSKGLFFYKYHVKRFAVLVNKGFIQCTIGRKHWSITENGILKVEMISGNIHEVIDFYFIRPRFF